MQLFLFFYILTLLFSCSIKEKKADSQHQKTNRYAQHFSISYNHQYPVLTIYNYYQEATNDSLTYDLQRLGIRIPVKKIAILSTTYIGFLDKLNEIGSICCLSGTSHIYHQGINERVLAGQIKEIGYNQNIDYETLISEKPDVVFAYAVSAEELPYVKRITSFGIPVIYVAEYMENHPLARAEWIKFFAAFFNKEHIADSIFSSIEESYISLQKKALQQAKKPGVLLNLPFNGVWYLPLRKSYFVKLIEDAGGCYLFDTLTGKDIFAKDQEWVVFHARNADVWLNAGNINRLSELNTPVYKHIKAVKSGNVFNPLQRTKSNGSNDFWEMAVVEPHLILEDFYYIFHNPDTNYSYHYYKKLEP